MPNSFINQKVSSFIYYIGKTLEAFICELGRIWSIEEDMEFKNYGISLVKWLLEFLYDHSNVNDIIGVICDYIETIVTGTKPKIVFVSRLRNKLS
ncbi:hypothetical protein SAMN02746089_02073 [Caldanaerobius fijiensis DSM 17918]|uniref:Uncharacterized protein n=1 Tax=Caldanaerobius fijiensis DSM 17918 TaxID=1121256 RepID=A0A1M5CAZ4_9THEO|nr:hypothetical protein SAMN02746089_02073 [Caldanaerobius fijiensis DSM 17918]